MGGNTINSVFYADTYHPIQAGSIDGTDILPHDNAVYRAHLCSSAGLYNPFGDPKVTGDAYCTLFVGRLSHLTNEDSLRKAMSKYGRVKNLRLVRHIVTGASCGYAFVEYETEREMRRAYEDAHHSIIDDFEIIVDYNRQQLMQGWIPRRLGGGLGGKKESGQLRFGGRERPFRAPLRPIPFDDLKKLGIPPPPEGRYMSRFQVPSPPRRKRSSMDREARSQMSPVNREEYSLKERSVDRVERSHRKRSVDREEESRDMASNSRRSSVDVDREESYHKRGYRDRKEQSRERNSISKGEHSHRRSSVDREESYHKRGSRDREAQSRERNSISRGEHTHRSSVDREESSHKRTSTDREERSHKRTSTDREERSHKRSFTDRKELSQERSSIDRGEQSLKRSSLDREESSNKRNSMDRDARSRKRQKHSSYSHRPERRRSSRDHF